MFKVEACAGDVTISEHPRLGLAIEAAMAALEDNPELGAVEVYGYLGDRAVYVGQATAVPDQDWQSVTGWLWAGQKITAPAINEVALMNDEDFEAYVQDAYGDDWAKAEGMRQMREAGWC